MKRGRTFIAVMVVSLLIAGGGVARQIEARSGDDAQDRLPAAKPAELAALAPAPFTVSISSLAGQRPAAVGASTPVLVSALGENVSELQLYDGDSLVARQRFEPAMQTSASGSFRWPVIRPGPHVLHATAIGTKPGQVAHSAPVRVEAANPVVMPQRIAQSPNGRSLAQVAAATGVRPDALQVIPIDDRGIVTGPPAVIADASAPLESKVVVEVDAAAIPVVAPPAPTDASAGGVEPGSTVITATMRGCTASVAPTSGAVSVYEATGGAAGFTLAGTASATKPLVTGDLTPGTHIFLAGPKGAPADSAPVAVTAGADCLADLWSGDSTLFDGQLTLAKPVTQLWVYLGIDGRPFTRVPAVGAVDAPGGRVDLAGLSADTIGASVRMEVWQVGDTPSAPATLVSRSQIDELPNRLDLADLLGAAPTVTLAATSAPEPVTLGRTATSMRFSWGATGERVNAVQWQVLGRPLFRTDRNTAPPVLLATGISAAGKGGLGKGGIDLTGTNPVEASTGGDFDVPAAMLLGGREADAPVDTLLAPPSTTIKKLRAGPNAVGATPIGTLSSEGISDGAIPAFVPMPFGDVYLRVLPLEDDSVIGDSSNTVPVTLPALNPAAAGFTVTSATLDPGRAANEELEHCARITQLPPPKPSETVSVPGLGVVETKPEAPISAVYPKLGTYCPSDFAGQGGGCQTWCQIKKDAVSFAEFVAEVWDLIAYVYNGIVDLAVEAIAKLNPYCLQARIAKELVESKVLETVSDGCEAVGRIVGAIAVSTALGLFGLPPRLPDSKELVDIAKGELSGIAVYYLEVSGVPCSSMTLSAAEVEGVELTGAEVPGKDSSGSLSVCKALVDAALDVLLSQLKQAVQDQVVSQSGLPSPPPGSTMIAEPRAFYTGARVTVGAQPIDPATPFNASCPISATGSVPSWKNVGTTKETKIRKILPGDASVRYRLFAGDWSTKVNLRPYDNLYGFESLSVQLSSPCIGNLAPIPLAPVRPALGYWQPGEED